MTVPRAAALRLIGLFKLIKGCLLAAVALELGHLGPEGNTASLIPVDLYAIARRADWIRVAVTLINVGIVWYLARGLGQG